ncbi:MAG: OmpA family protein, partial [Gemmatimonadetes bacterium]|nr:OmpA family protein [Gemmatimonadota bacterium]
GAVNAGPAEARVNVLPVNDPSALRGWVYRDCDGDRKPDSGDLETSGLAGIVVVLEDGRTSITDENGEYYFYPIAPGDHLVRVPEWKLPERTRATGETHRFVYALTGGEARANFGMCVDVEPDPEEAHLRFEKGVDAETIRRVSESRPPRRIPLGGVSFDTGRASLRTEADSIVAVVGEILRDKPSLTAVVEGHADVRPIRTAAFPNNYELSIARAHAVRNALTERHGIDAGRIATTGFGADRPEAEGRDSLSLQKNRRTEILIYDLGPDADRVESFDPETLEYRLAIVYAGEIPLQNVSIEDMMPPGLSFVPGSVRIDRMPATDPVLSSVGDSTHMRWDIGTVERSFQRTVRYKARIDSIGFDGPLVNRALVRWLDTEGRAVETRSTSAPVRLGEWHDRNTLVYRLGSVLFDTGKADLRDQAIPTLQEIIEAIRGLDAGSVSIEGHTDSRRIRTAEFPDNLALSRARAEAVRRYLADQGGFDDDLFTVRGFGASRPAAPNSTAAGMQTNRRVEATVEGETRSTPAANAGTRETVIELRAGAVEIIIREGGSIAVPEMTSGAER